jgi:hypothetical protein
MLLLIFAFGGGLCATALASAQEKATSSERSPDRPPIKYAAEEGVPKDNAAEKRRDYAVLEAVFNDVTSPKNPENKLRVQRFGPSKEIVVNVRTTEFEVDPGWDGESRSIHGDDMQTIPSDILQALKRRSREPVKSMADFKPANRDIVVTDLDQLTEDAEKRGEDSDDAFRKKYPTAWGYVFAHPPGYSKDGRFACVVLNSGPTGGHGMGWVHMLVKNGRRWEVRWRHISISE